MARADGRLEPGQPLRGAISARAWNRAQDAADVVLGATPSQLADGQSYSYPFVAALINIPAASVAYPHGGVAIQIGGASWSVNTTSSQQWPRAEQTTAINYLAGTIAVPKSLIQYETQSTILPQMFAVTVEPISLGQTVVRCAVAGICVAAIRDIASSHRYAALPTLRSAQDSAAARTGLLETSDCGYAVILERVAGWALIKL